MKKQTEIKKNIIKTILILIVLAIFAIIFAFSNQNSEQSTNVSRKITEKLTQNIEWVQKLEKNEREEALLNIEGIIRKMAHFSIYLLLGVTIMSLMLIYHMKLRDKILASFSFGFFYAIFDEVHQLFISGRSGKASDVLIDSCGVLVGIGIVLFIRVIFKKMLKRKRGREEIEML